MKQLLLSTLVVITCCIVGLQCDWLMPPAKTVEWGLKGEINITQGERDDIVEIYMMENIGKNWTDEYFPVCEFRIDENTTKVAFNSLSGWFEIRQWEDGKWYWFGRNTFDAERETYYLSGLRTEPDRVQVWYRVHIVDYNDEIPQWEGGDWTHYTHNLLETEEWGEEGDTESSSRRLIFEMSFSDKDRNLTEFTAELDNPECRVPRPKAVCDEILSLIEIDIPYPIVGRALVRRAKGKLIDREARDLFEGDSDEFSFIITIFDTDKVNSITSNFTLVVDDRNDNAPEFLTEDSLLVEVKEGDIIADKPFGQITLRDLDDPKLPNGNFTVSIKSIKKEPSSPRDPELTSLFGLGYLTGSGSGNEFEIDVVPKTSNFAGLAATYTLTLEAKDGANSESKQLSSEKDYVIIVSK